MAETHAAARVAELEQLIKKHQELYYNVQPEISDEEFDALWAELEDLDPANALLSRVGADRADGWPKARHIMPMGSQSKATDPVSFAAWAAKMNFPQYIVQYKLDGASLELQYDRGVFVRAVTRGDGIVGDDISPNAIKMKGVPAKIPARFTGGVRGEVLMPRAVHAEKYSDKANCRNAANGLMKRKDGKGSEDLTVVCYDAAGLLAPRLPEADLFAENAEGSGAGGSARSSVGSDAENTLGGAAPSGAPLASPFADEMEKLAWLRAAGFAAVPTEQCRSAAEVVEYRGRVMALRSGLPYDIDGLVVKGLEIDAEDAAKPRPEKQIAFKFSPEEAVTRLRDIEWSESGALYTPIGIVEPVRLAGTTVQRANLSNPGMIRAMGLKLGSLVVITKRGEIIPKIETLVENPPDAVDIEQPTICGACGSALVDADTSLFCPNEHCPKKELHRLEKWLAVLEVRDFGPALIRRLHASGRVKTIADLYTLELEELQNLERMGRLSAQKVLRNLRAVREVSLAEFLAGFDVEGVGLLVAEKLVKGGFPTLEALLAAPEADLVKIDGIAETMAATIVKGLTTLSEEMRDLLAKGAIRIRPPASSSAGAQNGVSGKSFCFTGELRTMKRSEGEKKVRDSGGSVKTAVSRDLDYLVTNDPASGSEKNRKAREYGLPIIDENAFLALLRQAGHES